MDEFDEFDEFDDRSETGQPLWYSVLTVFLLTFGGIIIPLLGWLFGLGLLWNSQTWSRREKILGTATGPVAAFAGFFIVVVGTALAEGGAHTFGVVTTLFVVALALTVIANLVVGYRLVRSAH